MGATTSIAWTQATWNPWIGCHKVSPGCAKCYAERLETRYGRDFSTVRRTSPTTWHMPYRLKEPSLIFTCSMSDFFIAEADGWRDEAWEVIRQTPQHTYQILTKRPERIADHLPAGWPLPNVWLGVSVENPYWADRRIPLLQAIPVRVRFLSCEPLLKRLDLTPFLSADSLIHWIIVGGESGSGARPMNLEWVRSLRDQCHAAGVAFFYKQEGGKPYPNEKDALLDGRFWREMPEVTP